MALELGGLIADETRRALQPFGMTDEKIHLHAVDGDQVQSLRVDEVVIVLPNGIEFSLFPGATVRTRSLRSSPPANPSSPIGSRCVRGSEPGRDQR